MRKLFLALMIVLLPLRGWVGDVMAVERLAPAEAAMAVMDCDPAHAHTVQATATHGNIAQAGGHDSDHASGDCGACTACQICHTVALSAMGPLAFTAALPAQLPVGAASLYVSAEPVPGFKPPIS